MGIVIESEIWEPNPALFVFLFICCCLSIYYLPTKTAANVFDHPSSASFLRFQRNFLVLFALSSVMEGSWAVFGEYELAYYGLSKDEMLKSLCVGCAVSLIIGSFLGVFSDVMGHKKFFFLFYMLHLFVSIWKIVSRSPAIWLASICLSLASSIFSFIFETFMVVEHEKLGQRQDLLNDMFWLMTFFESASFIVSQGIGNYLIDGSVSRNISSVWKGSSIVAPVGIVYMTRAWKENPEITSFKEYRASFHGHVFGDKRIWLLSWSQTCVHFSIVAFWILWAPLIVADGREASIGLVYPCLLGFKMLGSTGFPWLSHGPLALRIEEYLICAFTLMAIALTVVAYDYQEIEFLVILFCVFHMCIGVVLPSLARLRSMWVPNQVRGGMMSLSLLPANAALWLLLVLRSYEYIGNSTIIVFAAIALLSAAVCMHVLKKWGKQLHQSKHSL